jgi:hypothetical protein
VKRYLCSLVSLGLLQGAMGPVQAQPTYSFATLDVPGSFFPDRHAPATGINDGGQIVGYYTIPSTTSTGTCSIRAATPRSTCPAHRTPMPQG